MIDVPFYPKAVRLLDQAQPVWIDLVQPSADETAFVERATGLHLPSVLAVGCAIAALAWSWRRLPPGAHGLALGAAFTALSFFLGAKQAFCNYYYFVEFLVLLFAVLLLAGPRPLESEPGKVAAA